MKITNGKFLYNCRNCERFGEHRITDDEGKEITKVGCEVIDGGEKYPIAGTWDGLRMTCREYKPKDKENGNDKNTEY